MDILCKQASQMITAQRDVLARIAVDRQYDSQPELWKRNNHSGYSKSLRDAGYHFSYLAEALAVNDPSLFLDYVAWAKVLFAGLHFPPHALTASLECMRQALQETLALEMAAAAGGYLASALEYLPHYPTALEPLLSPQAPLFDLATHYIAALLQGNRRLASQLILSAVDAGVGIKDIYLYVFQSSQREIGRLWQMNRVSVAQEHFCTAATQMIMSQLYPHIFATPRIGRRLVATSVGGELHEIGIRMVVDFLELEGWDTYYLGANTPPESVIKALKDQQAHVLALSATISFHISKVTELIEQVRSAAGLPALKILVGGYPFNITADLWRQVGADGFARNAQDAVSAANVLFEGIL